MKFDKVISFINSHTLKISLILTLICVICVIINILLVTVSKKDRSKGENIFCKMIKKGWEKRFLFSYPSVLAILTVYIFFNWKICVSMQFFSKFDGNNILFIVWIILIVLPFYDIEGKGFKLHRKEEYLKERFEAAESKFIIDKVEGEYKENIQDSSGQAEQGREQ